mmetsp:Transcript_33205/g.55669  ORF Transcript_33205/g.55669 Transcript_33205/m.55669 type:complete len:251 (+) Transcript_33205:280-1032(+)
MPFSPATSGQQNYQYATTSMHMNQYTTSGVTHGLFGSSGSHAHTSGWSETQQNHNTEQVVQQVDKNGKIKKERKPRDPSKYNIFVKDEIPRIKLANPGMDHKSAFKLAAANWSLSPSNPRCDAYAPPHPACPNAAAGDPTPIESCGSSPPKDGCTHPVPEALSAPVAAPLAYYTAAAHSSMSYSPVETPPANAVETTPNRVETIQSELEEQAVHNDAGEKITATSDIDAEATLLPAEKRRRMCSTGIPET